MPNSFFEELKTVMVGPAISAIAKVFLIVVFIGATSSCEKIVYIDLNTTSPKIIVEGNVTNLPIPNTVLLSHSVNYYDPNVFPAVTGATVIISDNLGNSEKLTEVSPGKYQTTALQGVEGRTYTLNINADGKQYIAISTMPYHTPIDSVNFVPNRDSSSRRVVCRFADPPGILNWYKLQLTSKDTAAFDSTSIRIIADGFADGQELSVTYRTHFAIGDTVVAKLECIDKPTYDFYRTLPDVEGNVREFMSAPPTNPVTNISNGGLGYFAAYAVTMDSTVVH